MCNVCSFYPPSPNLVNASTALTKILKMQEAPALYKMQENCGVCMERPRTIRYRPCGHAVCCELCTIKACKPSQQSLICPTCREAVAQLELVPNSGERMECFQTAAQPGALSYKGVHVFLQAMCDSGAQEVADAARAVRGRWGKPDEGKLEAELLHAAAEGHTGAVTALLATPGLDVNAVDEEGRTALIMAAGEGQTEAVTALLHAPGLDVNAASSAGTALMLAAGQGFTETVTALLDAPCVDVNAVGVFGYTALMLAAGKDHTEAVTALLAAPGLDVNAVDEAPRNPGRTALMWAAKGGLTKTVTTLLAAPGLNVNAADGAGWTALMWAVGGGHTETVTALNAACRAIHTTTTRVLSAPRACMPSASRRRPTLLPAMELPSLSILSPHARSLPPTGTALEVAREDALDNARGDAIEMPRSTVLPALPGSTTVARLRRPRPPPSSPSPLPSPPPKKARTR